MQVVEVNGLGKHFRTRQRAAGLAGSARALFRPTYRVREAVRGVSFSLERGEMLAFIGPNGAGKSTMIKMLTSIFMDTMQWQHRAILAQEEGS